MSTTHHDAPTQRTRKKDPCGRTWVECECMYTKADMELRIHHGTGNRQRASSKVNRKTKPVETIEVQERAKVEDIPKKIGPCSDHPKYGGVRSPRTECTGCWAFYSFKHPDRIKKVETT